LLLADTNATATEQEQWRSRCPGSCEIETRLQEHFQKILVFVQEETRGLSFYDIERALIPLIFALGRLCLVLCLSYRHEELEVASCETRQGRTYRRRTAQSRLLGTFFGKVRYWRTYRHAAGGGYYPLDEQLKLPAGGFSFHLCNLMTRLATKMSYIQAALVVRCFLGWAPSQDTLERTVFGLARHTSAFFEHAALPEEDGAVMIIMIDCKATPTATEQELEKRRGPRTPALVPGAVLGANAGDARNGARRATSPRTARWPPWWSCIPCDQGTIRTADLFWSAPSTNASTPPMPPSATPLRWLDATLTGEASTAVVARSSSWSPMVTWT
jgi:hypothetical protein